MRFLNIEIIAIISIILVSCGPSSDKEYQAQIQERIAQYGQAELTVDLSHLEEWELEMIPVLMAAADAMDEVFWIQSYGSKEQLMDYLQDPYAREYALINYGPWDRLEGHTPFYPGFNVKTTLANFYPPDMTREEFDNWVDGVKRHPRTMIRRMPNGDLVSIPYMDAFAEQHQTAARLLREAAALSRDEALTEFLNLRAQAFLNDNFPLSERAWMQMDGNRLDIVIGPLDTLEDREFGQKAAHSAYLLLKDEAESKRLEEYAQKLPQWQKALPVPAEYKIPVPQMDTPLIVCDALYHAGHCNAGPKNTTLTLPNDQHVRGETGSRNIQIRNVMEVKFHEILKPIAQMLIHPDQAHLVRFDSFFHLTTLHEMAASLGLTHTISGNSEVRDALREHAAPIDAATTDLLSLFLIMELHRAGEFSETQLHSALVTSTASILRSARFGRAGTRGIADMMRFNHFLRTGAIDRCEDTGSYRVNYDMMQESVREAVEQLILIQGDGNYDAASNLIAEDGQIPQILQTDLDRIAAENIPVDVRFIQGPSAVGLD